MEGWIKVFLTRNQPCKIITAPKKRNNHILCTTSPTPYVSKWIAMNMLGKLDRSIKSAMGDLAKPHSSPNQPTKQLRLPPHVIVFSVATMTKTFEFGERILPIGVVEVVAIHHTRHPDLLYGSNMEVCSLHVGRSTSSVHLAFHPHTICPWALHTLLFNVHMMPSTLVPWAFANLTWLSLKWRLQLSPPKLTIYMDFPTFLWLYLPTSCQLST